MQNGHLPHGLEDRALDGIHSPHPKWCCYHSNLSAHDHRCKANLAPDPFNTIPEALDLSKVNPPNTDNSNYTFPVSEVCATPCISPIVSMLSPLSNSSSGTSTSLHPSTCARTQPFLSTSKKTHIANASISIPFPDLMRVSSSKTVSSKRSHNGDSHRRKRKKTSAPRLPTLTNLTQSPCISQQNPTMPLVEQQGEQTSDCNSSCSASINAYSAIEDDQNSGRNSPDGSDAKQAGLPKLSECRSNSDPGQKVLPSLTSSPTSEASSSSSNSTSAKSGQAKATEDKPNAQSSDKAGSSHDDANQADSGKPHSHQTANTLDSEINCNAPSPPHQVPLASNSENNGPAGVLNKLSNQFIMTDAEELAAFEANTHPETQIFRFVRGIFFHYNLKLFL